MRVTPHLLLGASLLFSACAGEQTALDEAFEETGIEGPWRDGVPAAELTGGKADIDGERGPRIAPFAPSEVWNVTRDWSDVDREAGVAWDEGSGLDWEAKFDAWVGQMTPVERSSGYGQTFRIKTPFGDRELDSPTLECAEVAILLRLTFASWYNLPFFLQGWDSAGRQSLFAGHFGFINKDGAIVGRFPAFRSNYRDYTDSWNPGDAWPTDTRLRGYRLGDDDGVEFLSTDGNEVGAGAYFDELFLNKRVGYFARLILLYYGSVNLVDEANMFHIEPAETRAGDVLLKRWQRRGIGHVIPVMHHSIPAPGRLELSVASGSMPRRQPSWENPASAKNSFTNDYTGGVGESSDGESYASLGGGIRRWRSAVLRSGRWRNIVPETDESIYISNTDHDTIAARPDQFEEILADVTPEEQLAVALEQVDAARRHLRTYPASCAARTRREDAFNRVYQLASELHGYSRVRSNAEYRRTEDYVFSELEYDVSRTCCWNRSTAGMAEIVLDYARIELETAEDMGMCLAPTVFRAETDGYARWSDHAASMGRGGEWNAWSEDETCSQRDVAEDTIAESEARDLFCESGPVDPIDPVDPVDPVDPMDGDACDIFGQDDSVESAFAITQTLRGTICADDSDYYLVEGGGEVVITFTNDNGDLDLTALTVEGTQLSSSTSVSDEEVVSHDSTFVVRVYGYSGAENDYTIEVR